MSESSAIPISTSVLKKQQQKNPYYQVIFSSRVHSKAMYYPSVNYWSIQLTNVIHGLTFLSSRSIWIELSDQCKNMHNVMNFQLNLELKIETLFCTI